MNTIFKVFGRARQGKEPVVDRVRDGRYSHYAKVPNGNLVYCLKKCEAFCQGFSIGPGLRSIKHFDEMTGYQLASCRQHLWKQRKYLWPTFQHYLFSS